MLEGLIDIMKNSKELHEPIPPSDRLIKEDEYPEPFMFTVEEKDLKEVMMEREIPEEKLKEFEEYVTADLGNWLRENARSFKIFLISSGRFNKRELSGRKLKKTIDWLAKDDW